MTPWTPCCLVGNILRYAPSGAPCERTKCCRSRVDLIVMSAVGKSAKFIDKKFVPGAFHQFDNSIFALRGERIGPGLLADLFRLDRHPAALQKTGEVVRLELAGTTRVLRNPDTAPLRHPRIAVDLTRNLAFGWARAALGSRR